MKRNIQKGSEEAQFWIDLMRFRQEWYSAKDDDGNWLDKNDEWFEKFVIAATELSDKYKNTDFYLVAKIMLEAYIQFIETEYKRKE